MGDETALELRRGSGSGRLTWTPGGELVGVDGVRISRWNRLAISVGVVPEGDEAVRDGGSGGSVRCGRRDCALIPLPVSSNSASTHPALSTDGAEIHVLSFRHWLGKSSGETEEGAAGAVVVGLGA